MAQLRELFEASAGADEDARLVAPTLNAIVELLRAAGETLSVDDPEQIHGEAHWLTDRSFTWPELEALRDTIQAEYRSAAEKLAAEEEPEQNTAARREDDEDENPQPPREVMATHGQATIPHRSQP